MRLIKDTATKTVILQILLQCKVFVYNYIFKIKIIYLKIKFIPGMVKPLIQTSVSHDSSEMILIFWLAFINHMK